jgi:hypothetical protein
MEDDQEHIEHRARSSLRPTHAQNHRRRTEHEGLTLVQSRWPDAKGPKDNVVRHKHGRERRHAAALGNRWFQGSDMTVNALHQHCRP